MADVMKFAKLRGRIIEKFGSVSRFSEALGLSLIAVSRKLNGVTGFSRNDILKWCEVLEIPIKDIPLYFFT